MFFLYAHQSEKSKKAYLLLVAFALFIPSGVLFAQTDAGRSYSYDSIDTSIEIRRDTTFKVAERQTYDFHGEYHRGFRVPVLANTLSV